MSTPANNNHDLTCWYLNVRRVSELVGNFLNPRYRSFSSLDAINNASNQYFRFAYQAAAKDALLQWSASVNLETLGQILLRNGKILPGKFFSHYSDFYCRSQDRRAYLNGRRINRLPFIYSKTHDLAANRRVVVQYHPEHLTSDSAWDIISGHRQLFVLAAVQTVSVGVVRALPYVVGTLLDTSGNLSRIGHRWSERLQVHVDEIDSFAAVRNEPQPEKKELDLLRSIPERKIKHAIAEIIGERFIQKDWGGERSDLISDRVKLDGKRISTAFIFKGPSAFRPLHMSDLGKRGNQIDRVFTEPVELVILQHCHEITSSVRGAMRAYATSWVQPRLFALIDGYDSLRLLRAYKKLGLTPIKSALNQSFKMRTVK